jgi:hypothetical protein
MILSSVEGYEQRHNIRGEVKVSGKVKLRNRPRFT